MKNHILRFSMLASVCFALLAFMASCEKEGKEPGGGGKPPGGGPATTCSIEGTLRKIPCGAGVLGGCWIRLNDGSFILPCESDVVNVDPASYQDGTRVKFGYKKITSGACDQQMICQVVVPPSTKARITCLEILPGNNDCNKTGYISYDEKCNVRLIKTENGSLIEPVNQDAVAPYNNAFKIVYNATPVYTYAATCTGQTPVQVNCIKPFDFCGTGCTPLTISNTYEPAEAVRILSAAIEAGCIRLKIGYSGCNNEDGGRFRMVWNGSWMKSMPPQVSLALEDTRPGTCNAYFEQEVMFDLSQAAPNPGSAVVIRLAGYEQPITYER